ncbi:MAG: hypothetical protein ACK5MY_04490 [Jhaorihella sp.]
MLIVERTAKIRRAYFIREKSIMIAPRHAVAVREPKKYRHSPVFRWLMAPPTWSAKRLIVQLRGSTAIWQNNRPGVGQVGDKVGIAMLPLITSGSSMW